MQKSKSLDKYMLLETLVSSYREKDSQNCQTVRFIHCVLEGVVLFVIENQMKLKKTDKETLVSGIGKTWKRQNKNCVDAWNKLE